VNAETMHGVVLCAGLGTRLRPLTSAIPKPAIPVGTVPAALRNGEQLLSAGFPIVHCNTHYLAPELERQLKAACVSRGWPSSRLRFWNEPELLETGGGIARMVHELSSEMGHNQMWDTLVVSGDIVADIPTHAMLKAWRQRANNQSSLMVTLPLDKPRKDITWIDQSGTRVCGFGADASAEEAQSQGWSARVFSNHQIISGLLLSQAKIEKKSSIDLFYRAALRKGESIVHIPLAPEATWFDIGTPESYLKCSRALASHSSPDHLRVLINQQIKVCIADQFFPANQQLKANLSRHDQSKDVLAAQDQQRLIRLEQHSWTWLGRLYEIPESFEAGLLALVARMESPATNNTLQVGSLQGQTLLAGAFSSSAQLADSLHSPLQACGFIDCALPRSLESHPLISRPILVPLSSLFAASSQELTNHASAQIFWILFSPSQQ